MPYVLRSRGLRFLVFLAAIVVFSVAGRSPAWSQSQGSNSQPSQEEMMKKMMDLATPDEHHKNLGALVGTWQTTVTMWGMGPEPSVSKGTSTYEWILGGRYLQSKQTGEWGGMPFEGRGLDGYDKGKKEYFSIWIDNMGTGMMKLTGQPSADGKGITYSGTSFDPMLGRDVSVREEMVWNNERSYTFTMYMEMPGPDGKLQEQKAMEMVAVKQ